jgi:hypothetical protein
VPQGGKTINEKHKPFVYQRDMQWLSFFAMLKNIIIFAVVIIVLHSRSMITVLRQFPATRKAALRLILKA